MDSDVDGMDAGMVSGTETAADLSSLRLNGTAQGVLAQLLSHGEMSVGALASVTEIAPSLVSRALRTLEMRGLVDLPGERSRPAVIAAGAAAALRAEAAQLRESAGRRAADIEGLAEVIGRAAPDVAGDLPAYWLVPTSADGPELEGAVRRVSRTVDACVPRGRRARGMPRRASTVSEVVWRLLVSAPEQVPQWSPPRVRLEARRSEVSLPFLEVLDSAMCCADVVVQGWPRRVWCRRPAQVALVVAGFEHWWAEADPL